MMALRFRDLVRWLVPAWFNAGDQATVNYVWASMLDAHTQRLRDGVTQRFPSYAGSAALKLLGRDRGIMRGRAETAAHYAARLKAWRYPRGHRVRGSAFALLEQLSEYWGGLATWAIDASGTRHDRSTAGAESYSYGNAWTWDDVSGWSRFWLGIDGPSAFGLHPDFGDASLFGGSLGTGGAYVWGMTGWTFNDTRAVRRLLHGSRPWRPAGTQPEWLIVSFDGSTPSPDVSWEHWSENDSGEAFNDNAGTQVAARDTDFRYVSLAPTWNNTYAGSPDNFPALVTTCDASTYAGADTWAASTTLPNGETYAGEDTWVDSVQLIDDGEGA